MWLLIKSNFCRREKNPADETKSKTYEGFSSAGKRPLNLLNLFFATISVGFSIGAIEPKQET